VERQLGSLERGKIANLVVSNGPVFSEGSKITRIFIDGREVRLEKVPGGLRLAAWNAGQLVKDAPVVALEDLAGLLSSAAEQGLLADPELDWRGEPAVGGHGASPGRSGELRDELRVERLDDERLRIARWIMRPNRGWELQETPVLLPAERFLGALEAAAAKGVLAGDPVE